MPDKAMVLNGRATVDAYRVAHAQLYLGAVKESIPKAHTPLLEKMLADLKVQGFNSINEFFTASELLNIQSMGFKDMVDFDVKATLTDRKALAGMWR